MTASMRFATLDNTSGAALTQATALALQTDEKEYADLTIQRIFEMNDIGQTAGQTKDATDPTGGCLIARSVTGAKIKFVKSILLTRSTNATNASFDQILYGYCGVRISDDGLSAYLFDVGGENDSITTGDKLVISFALSNN